MTPDSRLERIEKATLAAGSRQYVKGTIEGFIESSLSGLESQIGAQQFSVERVFATLGGIMAMRQLLRKVEADIRRGSEAQPPGA